MMRWIKDPFPGALNLKSLNLCYLRLYHHKSRFSFSTLHLKDICRPTR